MSTAGGGIIQPRSDIAVPVSIAATTVSVEAIAANTARKGLILTNISTGIVWLHYGAAASAAAFTFAIPGGIGPVEMPLPVYTGAIHVKFALNNGSLIGSELS